MAKKNTLTDLLGKITPEEREKFKLEQANSRRAMSLSFQFGLSIGREIVRKYLPTLSCDLMHTHTNISVTIAEGDECRRLSDVWSNKREEIRQQLVAEGKHKSSGKEYFEYEQKINDESQAEWKALREYHEMLEDKYLPKTVECYFHIHVDDEHMKEFKKGVALSLWDCDCSHYNCSSEEDIDVKEDEDGAFIVITLNRDTKLNNNGTR